MNIHADESEELLHLFLAKATNVKAQLCQREQILEILRTETRWRFVEKGAQQIGESCQALTDTTVLLGIVIRNTFNLVTGDTQVLAIFGQSDRRHVLGRELRRELKLFAYFRL